MAFMKPEVRFFSEEEAREEMGTYPWQLSKYEGWYSRLSAPGYLDATDWRGPYDTQENALVELMDWYEVDENGEEVPYSDGARPGDCPDADWKD